MVGAGCDLRTDDDTSDPSRRRGGESEEDDDDTDDDNGDDDESPAEAGCRCCRFGFSGVASVAKLSKSAHEIAEPKLLKGSALVVAVVLAVVEDCADVAVTSADAALWFRSM
jgi:hypothetical protein